MKPLTADQLCTLARGCKPHSAKKAEYLYLASRRRLQEMKKEISQEREAKSYV